MSSDSEDDCYGNVAQKLQSIKSKYYKEDKIQTSNILDDSFNTEYTSKKVNNGLKIPNNNEEKDSAVEKSDSDCDEISLDAIIAQNTKKRITRNYKRNADISADNILPTRNRKKAKVSIKANESLSDPNFSNESVIADSTHTPVVPKKTVRGRRRGRGRGRASISTPIINTTVNASNVTINATNVTINATTSFTRTNTSVPANIVNNSESLETSDFSSNLDSTVHNASRGRRDRGQQRGRRRRGRSTRLSDMLPNVNVSASQSSREQIDYPTYSVGNTMEYPDQSHNQPLFTEQKKMDDVIYVGDKEPENNLVDENEEFSVKVHWQNREYTRFNIRRFQKFTQIFEFYAKRENISYDNLFFMYNDKIIKIDDTPESIAYSFVKFIEGGIIKQSMVNFHQIHRGRLENGLTIQFQSQNDKKRFVTTVRSDEKIAVAMLKYAEHLEKPMNKLKFYFDGDLITGQSTPQEMDLEGFECIDVKISP